MRLRNFKTIRLNTFLSTARVAWKSGLRHSDSGRVAKLVLLAVLSIVTPLRLRSPASPAFWEVSRADRRATRFFG